MIYENKPSNSSFDMMEFMQESAQDELAIFEAGIKSDMKEVRLVSEGAELEALNEGFIESAKAKITSMMKKFMSWLDSVIKTVLAKLNNLVVRDAEKFVATASVELKRRDTSDFKYSGKALKVRNINAADSQFDAVEKKLSEALSKITSNSSVEQLKAANEALGNDKENSKRDMLGELVEEVENEGIAFVMAHLEVIKNSAEEVKALKKLADGYKKDAQKIIKSLKSSKDDASEEAKKEINEKISLVSKYKTLCQKYITKRIKVVKGKIKVARAVVTKALGKTKSVKESTVAEYNGEEFFVEFSEELTDSIIEVADAEYDAVFDGEDSEDSEDFE